MSADYLGGQASFDPAAVKQEPMEALTKVDQPMDMSMSGREDPRHEIYISPYHRSRQQQQQQQHHHHHLQLHSHHRPHPQHHPQLPYPMLGSPNEARLREPTQMPVGEPLSPEEVQGVKVKGVDRKLTIPALLASSHSDFSELDGLTSQQRARREFVPENRKDEGYWKKRIKNNDSARRSRVKRKALEKLMESRLIELQKENIQLKHEMLALRRRFGMDADASASDVPGPSGIELSPPSPPPSSSPAKLGQDQEDLEQQSAGSDDSQSLDDARSYSLASVAALNHSLRHRQPPPSLPRSRTDSIGSSSSGGSGRSVSRPDSRLSLGMRMDKSGALDLTSSDHSNRSTPDSQVEAESHTRRFSSVSSDMEDRGKEVRAFPLKCRWKQEMLRSTQGAEDSR